MGTSFEIGSDTPMGESGKIVVVTGASSGIGAALARRLGARGYGLTLCARRQNALDGVAGDAGQNTLTVRVDVTNRLDVERLRDAALDRFGRIDVWINNAGRGIVRPVLDLTDEDVDDMIAVNLKSALYGMQAVVPHFMSRSRGHVITVSSFLSRVPTATFRSIYSAAKAALNILAANLRMDLAPRYPDIHVSTILPSIVITDFARHALGAEPTAGVPNPPPGPIRRQTAEEIAEIILGVIDHPVAEVYTQPALVEIARRYFDNVEAFEAAAAARQS